MSQIGERRPVPDAGGPWMINVADRAYGPYSGEQMRAFVGEGRLVAMSQTARAGETEFRNAVDDPDLAPLFLSPRPASAASVEPLRARPAVRVFGKQEDATRPGTDAESSGLSHFIIAADMKSRSISGLEEEIAKLGAICPVLPQVWLLTTGASVNAVRNLLVQQLGKLDTLLVVDASRDKAAWFNFGPEMDARIRRLWSKPAEGRKTP